MSFISDGIPTTKQPPVNPLKSRDTYKKYAFCAQIMNSELIYNRTHIEN